jgi:hypothetical protein
MSRRLWTAINNLMRRPQKRCSICEGHNVDCHFCFASEDPTEAAPQVEEKKP